MMFSRVISLQYIKEAFDVTKLADINEIIKNRIRAGEEIHEPSFCSVAMEKMTLGFQIFAKLVLCINS